MPRDWRQLQAQDAVVNQFVRAVTRSRNPDVAEIVSSPGKILLREFGKLVIKRGVLYRRICDKDEIHISTCFARAVQSTCIERGI